MTWNRWKIAAVLVSLLFWACVGVTAAKAEDISHEQLNDAASWIAQQNVAVDCMKENEPDSPASIGAWAYVQLFFPVIYADSQVCEGALAIKNHDSSVPLWEQALGALVLTHEAYHLRLSLSNRGNEAATECRAIRHAAYMMQRLGADESLVQILMPFALAIHWQLAAKVPNYNLKTCQVPWYW